MRTLPAEYFSPDASAITDWGVPDWKDAAAYPTSLSPREWAWEFLRRSPVYRHDWQLDRLSPAAHYMQRAVDPRGGAKPDFIFPGQRRVHIGPGEFRIFSDQAAIVIDLAAPIEPQLIEAKRILFEAHKHKHHLRTDKFPLYSRVLDGCDAGASDAEIARVLYPRDPSRFGGGGSENSVNRQRH